MYILKHPAVIIFGAFIAVPVSIIFLAVMAFIYFHTNQEPETDCEYEKYHNRPCVVDGEL